MNEPKSASELAELLNDGEYAEFAYQVARLYGSLDYRKISDTIAAFHGAIKDVN
jgi:hypothetical protein